MDVLRTDKESKLIRITVLQGEEKLETNLFGQGAEVG